MRGKRLTRRRLCVAAVIVVTPAVSLGMAWYCGLFRTAEEQLAAIEAARMVRDSENAGVLYMKMALARTPSPSAPHFLDSKDAGLARELPWSGEDYPELVEYIEGHRGPISELTQNLKFEKCYFPLPPQNRRIDERPIDPTRHMRGWVHLLLPAANNDIAEARTEGAIEKYLCVMRMSAHLYQQPVRSYYGNGLYLETHWASEALKGFILQGQLSEEQLTQIESALPPAGDTSESPYRMVDRVESLVSRIQRGQTSLISQLRLLWLRFRGKRTSRGAQPRHNGLYLWVLTQRRGLHILIALRRYRDETGQWPESFKQMKLPRDIVKDPYNDDAFVYRLTEGGFTLYSKGINGVDDSLSAMSDDLPIWSSQKIEPNAKEESVNDDK